MRDISGENRHPAGGERRCDFRLRSDTDFDGVIDPSKCVDEGSLGVGTHEEETYDRWGQMRVYMRIDIVPVGDVPASVKRDASAGLRSVYDCDVFVRPEQRLPNDAHDDRRDQYKAEAFIDLATRVAESDTALAVTDADLFYRRRNYVFGLAYLDGRGCVVSTDRLRTSSDGGVSQKPASEVFADRVRKEVVHEVGHTLGLEHCDNSRCVMNFSPTVREVDIKEEHLCGTCQRNVL
jgi:archaemetzincin